MLIIATRKTPTRVGDDDLRDGGPRTAPTLIVREVKDRAGDRCQARGVPPRDSLGDKGVPPVPLVGQGRRR